MVERTSSKLRFVTSGFSARHNAQNSNGIGEFAGFSAYKHRCCLYLVHKLGQPQKCFFQNCQYFFRNSYSFNLACCVRSKSVFALACQLRLVGLQCLQQSLVRHVLLYHACLSVMPLISDSNSAILKRTDLDFRSSLAVLIFLPEAWTTRSVRVCGTHWVGFVPIYSQKCPQLVLSTRHLSNQKKKC